MRNDRPWKWKFCELECDNVALLRCSRPRPWTLGTIYALRSGPALYVALKPIPVLQDPSWPDSWIVTDWCLTNAGGEHLADGMLLDAIRRTLGYWDERPAGGMVIYLPAKLGAFQTDAGLANVGFVAHPDKVLPDGRVPWHLPAAALPKPIRRRAASARTSLGAGYRRGERV